MLHVAQDEPFWRIWSPMFEAAVREIGELELVANGRKMPDEAVCELARRHDVLITGWDARPVPDALADDPGRLKYICHVTGEMRRMIPLRIVESGITVTNWGDAIAPGVAEGAMVLLLALTKNLRGRIRRVEEGGWGWEHDAFTSTVIGMDVGVYGCGVIGRAFIEMLRPYEPVIRVFDPYAAEIPEGCQRVEDLDDLFRLSEAVAVHAGLTRETRKSVNAERLALMRDNGIVINTARGGIVDEAALFAELEAGRLLAGLDVLDPDRAPPEDHPCRSWPNLILTGHRIGTWGKGGKETESLVPWHTVCLENLRRFRDGEDLMHVMDRERYERST